MNDIVSPIEELIDAMRDAINNGEGELLASQVSRALDKHGLVVMRTAELNSLVANRARMELSSAAAVAGNALAIIGELRASNIGSRHD